MILKWETRLWAEETRLWAEDEIVSMRSEIMSNCFNFAHNLASCAHNLVPHAHNLVSLIGETRRDEIMSTISWASLYLKTLASETCQSDFLLRIPGIAIFSKATKRSSEQTLEWEEFMGTFARPSWHGRKRASIPPQKHLANDNFYCNFL